MNCCDHSILRPALCVADAGRSLELERRLISHSCPTFSRHLNQGCVIHMNCYDDGLLVDVLMLQGQKMVSETHQCGMLRNS